MRFSYKGQHTQRLGLAYKMVVNIMELKADK